MMKARPGPRSGNQGARMPRTSRTWAIAAIAAGFAAALGFAVPAAAGPTLDKVKQGGALSCGVPTGIPGFAQPDNQGKYTGFDVDICRAISAAVFGDPDKVKYVPLTAQQRFRSEEHTSELQSQSNLVCRLLLEKKNKT